MCSDGGLASIPEGLDQLIGFSAACSCGKTHSVDLEGVSLHAGALPTVVDWVRKKGSGLSLGVVVDRISRELAGDQVRRLLEREGHRVRLCELVDGPGERPHAEEGALAKVEAALADIDLAVAVGSGTVNDLTKLASFRRKIPYLVVATAPSMNGYTSAIAAMTLAGVKRTVACHQPYAVVADLDLLQQAPAHLIAAGLGDLESKPTSTTDYRLGGLLRGEYYCPAPERVVLAAEARVAEAAADIGRKDPAALALLTEALLLSGLSMKLAGTSSPASGGEHLISHFWDMQAEQEGRVEGWHGAQVGVATMVMAALYEELQDLRPAQIDWARLSDQAAPPADLREQIAARHGAHAQLVYDEFMAKQLWGVQLARHLDSIRQGWDGLWQSLRESLRPAARVREILQSAGAPTTVSALGLDRDHLRRALRGAREIRARYTVLDFAYELGVLPARAEAVIARSRADG